MAVTLPIDSVWTQKSTRHFSSSPAWRRIQDLASKSRPRPACCHIASPRPLVAPPTHPLVAPAGCCVASRRAALSSYRRLVVPPLVVSSHQLVVASSSLVVLSLHRPLVLSSCLAQRRQGEAGRRAARRRRRAAQRRAARRRQGAAGRQAAR